MFYCFEHASLTRFSIPNDARGDYSQGMSICDSPLVSVIRPFTSYNPTPCPMKLTCRYIFYALQTRSTFPVHRRLSNANVNRKSAGSQLSIDDSIIFVSAVLVEPGTRFFGAALRRYLRSKNIEFANVVFSYVKL